MSGASECACGPQAHLQCTTLRIDPLTYCGKIRHFSAKLSLGELASRTGLYRSTILRLAASMSRYGYLHRDHDGAFSLGPTLWRLGGLYSSAFDLSQYVRPVLGDLVRETGESAGFYIRHGDRRLCLYRLHSPNPIRHHIDEGAELPLGRGAGSHVLSAYTGGEGEFHKTIRKQGYCFAAGENDPHTGGVYAPVFGGRGRFIGTIGVAGFKDRFEGENLVRITEIVIGKARALSQLLFALQPALPEQENAAR